MLTRMTVLGTTLLFFGWSSSWAQEPLAEGYLLRGKLAEGEAALKKRLIEMPTDDQARFGLGVTQFLQSFEHLGQSLYRFGLRTERSFVRPAPVIRELLPQNPNPEKLTYDLAQKILQTFVDDLTRAEATLADVNDRDVKLSLHVALIKIDPFGLDKPVNAAFLLTQNGQRQSGDLAQFVIAFDRGDVSWLRGYCHFLLAWGETLLAIDGRELFECSAHWTFERVETPYSFLVEDRQPLDANPNWMWNQRRIADAIATIHLLLKMPLQEPNRLMAAHGHLKSMLQMSRDMWTFYGAETDDDREWIPNPTQTGVLRVPVTSEMQKTWLATVDEAELVLDGKRLVPFWRGADPQRGINLRRVFLELKEIDIPLWIQGTAAAPFLENGETTRFANPETLRRINEQFRGSNFIGFAFWFN